MKSLQYVLTVTVLVLGFFLHSPAYGQDNFFPKEKSLFTKHFQDTLFDITGRGVYSIEVLLDDKEYKKLGKDVIGIVVHNSKDDDVAGAEITISLKDLETGKNNPGPFIVKDKGNGLYIIPGLDLKRNGRWELSIGVKKDNTSDAVKFVLPAALKERVPKGRYSP